MWFFMIKNNINVFLLIVIVILAAYIVVYSQFEQQKYKNAFEELQLYKNNFSQCKSELQNKDKKLKQTFKELQEKLQDSLKFEGLYNNIVLEKESLQKNLDECKSDLSSEKSLRISVEEERDSYYSQLSVKELELQKTRELLDSCQLQLQACTSKQ